MENNNKGFYTAQLIISYLIFGSIGIFVRAVPLASSVIAAFRGIAGALFIFIFILITGRKIAASEIRKNALWLTASGAAIGFNWIFLFEAYSYTSIATATLCYYMAPVFVVAAAPLILKERLTLKNIICIAVALCGMVPVSGAAFGGSDIYGIIFGLLAALLYAVAIICNKKMGEISSETRAMSQLFIAGLTVLPYALLTADVSVDGLGTRALVMLLTVGIVHTGLAYVLNLGSVAKVPAGTMAVLSYIDPVFAIILESVTDKALPSLGVILGAVLILGATAAASLEFKRKN